MPRGGQRPGAGRKPGVGNLLTETLKQKINAERMIEVLQEVATGKIKDTNVRDRVAAASALLDKLMPNQKSIEIDASFRSETIYVGPGAEELAEDEAQRLVTTPRASALFPPAPVSCDGVRSLPMPDHSALRD